MRLGSWIVALYHKSDTHAVIFHVRLKLKNIIVTNYISFFIYKHTIFYSYTFALAITTPEHRSPMMAPFLASQPDRTGPESIFYSPLETVHNSDDEDDEQVCMCVSRVGVTDFHMQ